MSQRIGQAGARGLVRRHRPGPDGRTFAVELTPAGHALVERTVDQLLDHEETLLAALTPDQRDGLTALLRILLADLPHPTPRRS